LSAIVVIEPTLILSPPERDVTANVSDVVRLPCEVRTDPAERDSLRVEWRRDGVIIDTTRVDADATVDPADFSLQLSNARVSDTAAYTCHADNGLDHATSEPTNLIVRGTLSLNRLVAISGFYPPKSEIKIGRNFPHSNFWLRGSPISEISSPPPFWAFSALWGKFR